MEKTDLDRVNECTEHSCNAQEWLVNREYRVVDGRHGRLAGVGVEEREERRERLAHRGRRRHREGEQGWGAVR